MAIYRSRTKEIEEKITGKDKFWDFDNTANEYGSRIDSIERRINNTLSAISDPETLANLGVSLGKRFLIKKRIESNGKIPTAENLVRGLLDLSKSSEKSYESKSSEITEKINSQKGTTNKPHFDKSGKQKSVITIVNVDGQNDSVQLTWIPKTINYKAESKLAALLSVGRNNPFYHYGGSEDTIDFTIDWTYTDDTTRLKAIQSARWLESLTKSDGYNGPLNRVQLIWGFSNLFQGSLFLVESAHYEMYNWVDWGINKVDNNYEFKRFGLLPQSIKQDVVLKRVVNVNLQHEDIRRVNQPRNP